MLVPAASASAASVDVLVSGIRNGRGTVRVAICTQSQFLRPSCDHVGHAPARPGTVTVRVEGVAPGTWAAQAFHDEDDDGQIGRTMLGLPSEGIGFSNDARFRFGPPRFTDAAFRITGADARIRIPLRYDF